MKKFSMKRFVKDCNFFAIMMVIAMSIVSCGKDDPEPTPEPPGPTTPTTITVRNNGTYTLNRFRIIFLNSSREKLSEKDCGTLAPNDQASAKIPTAAKEYYMATYLYNDWFFSPYYDISYANLILSDAEIGNWSKN